MSESEKQQNSASRVTLNELRKKKAKNEQITIVTAYDWSIARLLDLAGIDIFVVGDSLGMNVLGYDTTLPVTVEDIVHHTRAVARGRKRAMVVADMPYLSYEVDVLGGLHNASRLIKEGNADAVKVEGGTDIAELVGQLRRAKIPTMGHLGITPQSHLMTSGFTKLPGRTEAEIDQIIADADALVNEGVFAILLECVPSPLATFLAKRFPQVIWLGLGSGSGLDGQGMVHTDLLGLPSTLNRRPRFVKAYADLSSVTKAAAKSFRDEVASGVFPAADNIYPVSDELLSLIEERTGEATE